MIRFEAGQYRGITRGKYARVVRLVWRVVRALAPALLGIYLIWAFLQATSAQTQEKTRPRSTPRPSRPAQTSQAPVGPYVPPSSDQPPPNPCQKPSTEPQRQKS